MSLVVTATDTEVGKTVVSALLLRRYAAAPLAYWKPVATGSKDDRDRDTVRALTSDLANLRVLDETYRFREPLSPHLAARLEDARVDPEHLVREHQRLEAIHGPGLVVEGIGGLLVPLADGGPLLSELFRRLGLPLVIVARSGLGTINHTLLTLEAARRRGLEVLGVVLVGPPNAENRAAIEAWGDVSVVAEVPWLDEVDRPSLAAAARTFDPDGVLAPGLGDPPGESAP